MWVNHEAWSLKYPPTQAPISYNRWHPCCACNNMKMKKKVGTKRKRNEEKHPDLKIRPYILFRSSSNDHIHINDRGSKNFLQKYFAEPYFSSCFFCCRSVLPSWGKSYALRPASRLLVGLPGWWPNPIIMNEIPLRPPIASAQLPRSFRIPSADPVENLWNDFLASLM